ncbi:hypothetical protein IRT45_34905 [Nocardia sp. BSTN01]|uniref:hypothetical protein n=1 Tax=Nocardia sp. BSTN01 TaxID=2783665 RepID=UPI00188F6D79|nr:hypothetical protein [Nocardia sp. BSTN01]MBF5002310.1 hypothetical protein [Nocardia sp. BSTN01]
MRVRKKPVEVEAHQWFKNGDHPDDYVGDIPAFGTIFTAEYRREQNWDGAVVGRYRHPEVPGDKACEHCGQIMDTHGWIDTLEGGHIVCPGDWVITGVEGERYPCKPGIFAKTYATVERSDSASDKINQLIEAARLQVADIEDKSTREQLIADLADALEETTDQAE